MTRWLMVALFAGAVTASAAPQTQLCQPCGWEGCQVPWWPTAVCNGGVCRPACGGGEKFQCSLTSTGVRRARCVPSALRHCARPWQCP